MSHSLSKKMKNTSFLFASMEEEIVKQEEAVERSKAKYDAEVKKLKDMYAKREEARRKALLDAVEKSSKSYEEIMAFVTARQED